MPENGDEFGNGEYEEGDYGELVELGRLIAENRDDISEMVLLDFQDGEGFANVKIGDDWHSFDLEDFDRDLWEEFFDWLDAQDIEYVVYQE